MQRINANAKARIQTRSRRDTGCERLFQFGAAARAGGPSYGKVSKDVIVTRPLAGAGGEDAGPILVRHASSSLRVRLRAVAASRSHEFRQTTNHHIVAAGGGVAAWTGNPRSSLRR